MHGLLSQASVSGKEKWKSKKASRAETRRGGSLEIWLITLLSFLSMPAHTSWRCNRFLIPLNPHLFHHCHSLLCGSDNGSNYAGSVFVPHHNYSMGRDVTPSSSSLDWSSIHICCMACTPDGAQTSWNKMVFVKLVIESFSFFFFFFLSCSFHPLFTGQVFYQA